MLTRSHTSSSSTHGISSFLHLIKGCSLKYSLRRLQMLFAKNRVRQNKNPLNSGFLRALFIIDKIFGSSIKISQPTKVNCDIPLGPLPVVEIRRFELLASYMRSKRSTS